MRYQVIHEIKRFLIILLVLFGARAWSFSDGAKDWMCWGGLTLAFIGFCLLYQLGKGAAYKEMKHLMEISK